MLDQFIVYTYNDGQCSELHFELFKIHINLNSNTKF
jgi:hypothetical protein